MAKKKSNFVCQSCGENSTKWLGRCPSCNEWDSFVEFAITDEKVKNNYGTALANSDNAPIAITEIQEDQVKRLPTLDEEFDLVLGGGIVEGSLVLIGGAPGVGKSTLLLKIAGNIAKSGHRVLYVSGEESKGQIKLRANRLNANYDSIFLLSEIVLENILSTIEANSYEVVIIDSIQTLYSSVLSSAPGSVSQVREITFHLMRIAKEKKIAIFIIGHITKEGSIAGPRVLEHMVDTVLYFDSNLSKDIRMLRAFKNRFGSTNEIAIFEMAEEGLVSVKNLAMRFLDMKNSQQGSALTVILEGSRALVIEVQALVSDNAFGMPKRSSNGFDTNRLTMLLALLEKKMGFEFNQLDVFINITGGIKVNEPSADLAIIAAIISSLKNRPISKETIFIGEVSLTGDVREVHSIDTRIKEISSQGFSKVILRQQTSIKDIKYFEVDKVEKLLDWM